MISYNENENKMENNFHGYNISRPRPRYGHKYTKKEKKCLSIMVLICIKQHLRNIWGSIH